MALRILIPSFLQRPLNPKSKPIEHDPIRRRPSTAALDGLRGFAALIVFFYHVLRTFTPLVEYGYGAGGDAEGNHYLVQLPWLSLWMRGQSMVPLFFVVGGYVTGLKALGLMYEGRGVMAAGALVPSLFRRGIRLFVPAAVASFLAMTTVYLGLWECSRRFITEDTEYFYFRGLHPMPLATYGEQITDWFYATTQQTDLFYYYNKGSRLPHLHPYIPDLWTLPFEYRASLVGTLVLLATSRCRAIARQAVFACAIIFCGCWDRWELVCFLSGTLLCDIDLGLQTRAKRPAKLETIFEEDEEKLLPCWENAHTSRDTSQEDASSGSTKSQNWPILFILGLYLLSAPSLALPHTPGYQTLSQLTPSTYTASARFLPTLGAISTVWSITNCSALQRPFNTAVAQYLGRISFSVYLIHGPLLHVLGYTLAPTVWIYVLGGGDGWRWVTGLVVSTVVLLGVVIIVADLFWRVVDQRAQRFASWVQGVCFVEG